MSIDFSGVRWVENGEPLAAVVLNRPLKDVVDIVKDLPTASDITTMIEDEALIAAIVFGGE